MRKQQEQSNDNYLRLDNGENNQYARLQFSGKFQNKVVTWKCEFLTAKEEYGLVDSNNKPDYIKIGQASSQEIPLRVVLNIPAVSHQEIEKMIVMIRNYKRLRVGLFEFGQSVGNQQ